MLCERLWNRTWVSYRTHGELEARLRVTSAEDQDAMPFAKALPRLSAWQDVMNVLVQNSNVMFSLDFLRFRVMGRVVFKSFGFGFAEWDR